MIATPKGIVMGGPRSAARHHDRHDQGQRPGYDLTGFEDTRTPHERRCDRAMFWIACAIAAVTGLCVLAGAL